MLGEMGKLLGAAWKQASEADLKVFLLLIYLEIQ